jgi:probable rRNA maturation factor
VEERQKHPPRNSLGAEMPRKKLFSKKTLSKKTAYKTRPRASALHIEFLADRGERVPKAFLQSAVKQIQIELSQPRNLVKAKRQKLDSARLLQLVFVTEAKMRKLNLEFRKIDRSTDVLSFSPTEPHSLGELVFALEVLKRQAKAHDMKFRDELGYMVLHGVLHLLGYDHERSEANAKRMFVLQDKIFDAVRRRW